MEWWGWLAIGWVMALACLLIAWQRFTRHVRDD